MIRCVQALAAILALALSVACSPAPDREVTADAAITVDEEFDFQVDRFSDFKIIRDRFLWLAGIILVMAGAYFVKQYLRHYDPLGLILASTVAGVISARLSACARASSFRSFCSSARSLQRFCCRPRSWVLSASRRGWIGSSGYP